MEKHYSLVAAEKVLELVKDYLPTAIDKDCTLKVWANGREQGFYICRTAYESGVVAVSVVFAQQRNSDEIVVVAGPPQEFDITTNAPSEKVWESGRKCYATHDKAARAIVAALKKGA